MRMRSRTFLILALLMPLGITAQHPFFVEHFETRVEAGLSDTYHDLLRKVFPSMSADDDGDARFEHPIKLRRLSPNGGEEITVYETPSSVVGLEAWWFKAGSARHLALLIATAPKGETPEKYVLAVFKIVDRQDALRTGEFALLDAIDPQTDRFTSLPDELPLIAANPGNEFFWLLNYHWTASESYRSYEAVRLVGGKRLEIAIRNVPGRYYSMDCSDMTETTLRVVRNDRIRKMYLPYQFYLRTLTWTRRQCEAEKRISYPKEERHIYQAHRGSAENGSPYSLLRVKISRKRVRHVQEGYR